MKTNERNITIKARCEWCSKVFEINVTEESIKEYFSPNRRTIQEIFPYLTASERELLISHTCESCWDGMFNFNEEAEKEFDCEEYYKADGNISCEELSEQW